MQRSGEGLRAAPSRVAVALKHQSKVPPHTMQHMRNTSKPRDPLSTLVSIASHP